MGPWINYHHLFYFKVIAEEQSVSKAALKLRLGQPTLSAQLKQFESALGVTLFERQHKQLFLTEQGKVAFDYARNIFKMGSEMYEVLHDKIKPARLSLCIASLDSISKHTVLDLTQAALNVSPCQITLLEGKSDELMRELSAHKADILVTNFIPTAGDARGLKHRSIAKNKVSFYGAPRFKSLKKNFPESLSTEPVLLPTYDSKMRYDIEHWSQLTSIPLDILTESQDIAVKKLMAVNGMGLLPAAAHTVAKEIGSGELVEIGKLQGVHEELFLVTAQRKIENPIAKELFKNFSL
jgi:LysR family transcriptional activator of nhaA